MNVVSSKFFKPAMDKITAFGAGPPNYHALRVPLLKEAKTQVTLTIDALRIKWGESGCTIMCDGWKDQSKRPLIKFLVYSRYGVSFIKSYDASRVKSSSQLLCNLFSNIVELVGKENVVHMVTDNAANYKGDGKKWNEKYPKIYCSPCSAHCLNLILEDIGKMTTVLSCVSFSTQISSFFYNNKWCLGWLRARPGRTEIVRLAATRFGTNFIALKSLL